MSGENFGYTPSPSGPHGYQNDDYIGTGALDDAIGRFGDTQSKDNTQDVDNAMMNTLWLIVADESDELTATTAQLWRDISALLEATRSNMKAHAEALAEKWRSPAAESFLRHVGAGLYSLDEWKKAADENAAALSAISGQVSRTQTEVKQIWEDYKVREASEMADRKGSLAADLVDFNNADSYDEVSREYANKARPHVQALATAYMEAIYYKLGRGTKYKGPTDAAVTVPTMVKPSVVAPTRPGGPGRPGGSRPNRPGRPTGPELVSDRDRPDRPDRPEIPVQPERPERPEIEDRPDRPQGPTLTGTTTTVPPTPPTQPTIPTVQPGGGPTHTGLPPTAPVIPPTGGNAGGRPGGPGLRSGSAPNRPSTPAVPGGGAGQAPRPGTPQLPGRGGQNARPTTPGRGVPTTPQLPGRGAQGARPTSPLMPGRGAGGRPGTPNKTASGTASPGTPSLPGRSAPGKRPGTPHSAQAPATPPGLAGRGGSPARHGAGPGPEQHGPSGVPESTAHPTGTGQPGAPGLGGRRQPTTSAGPDPQGTRPVLGGRGAGHDADQRSDGYSAPQRRQHRAEADDELWAVDEAAPAVIEKPTEEKPERRDPGPALGTTR